MQGRKEGADRRIIDDPNQEIRKVLGYEYLLCDSWGPIDHIPVRIDLDKLKPEDQGERVTDILYEELKEMLDKGDLFPDFRLCVFIKVKNPQILQWFKIELLIALITLSNQLPIIIFDTLSPKSFSRIRDELALYGRSFAVLNFVAGPHFPRGERIFRVLNVEYGCPIYLIKPPLSN